MNVLYICSRGVNDPTGATMPLHLAANGSLEAGQGVSVVLGGDATLLARKETADAVHGVGLPPATDLFAKLAEHEVPVWV
ncbi:MAG: DsrE family protein [Actinomycetota bacterium]|nr:DsrE family protein [Actinomycetota bacterium]